MFVRKLRQKIMIEDIKHVLKRAGGPDINALLSIKKDADIMVKCNMLDPSFHKRLFATKNGDCYWKENRLFIDSYR